jgi:hypothetical protein
VSATIQLDSSTIRGAAEKKFLDFVTTYGMLERMRREYQKLAAAKAAKQPTLRQRSK